MNVQAAMSFAFIVRNYAYKKHRVSKERSSSQERSLVHSTPAVQNARLASMYVGGMDNR